MPLFVKLGYGVHGNESSGQNASALVAYYLIAGEGREMDELLKNTIILIDPALNPDGMQSHSTWVNFAKSLNNNPDPASMEFSESWPGGRTNHYWFDLNRDYLMLQQPESRGRVAAFHKWKPNINTDHHETGANETFFFQPGIQSRNNPLTPKDNQDLTAEIGKYHEKYLNSLGSLYFTEESFDDFYVGKGSSYPDIHGSVGILFEQAGVKGHLRETPGGLLSFPFAIRNHFTVSLSTLEAGLKMREKLLESQRNFYKDALVQADKHIVKGYIFNEPTDNARVSEFINILLQHRIKVYRTNREVSKNGITYKSENSYIVPLKQVEYRFIRSLFEPVTEFTDSLFYDTSTWVLPMAFNLNCSPISIPKDMEGLIGTEITSVPVFQGKQESTLHPYAWLFEWNEYYSPKALYYLQNKGLKARVATENFVYDDGNLKKTFSAGTVIVPVSGQTVSGDDLYILMQNTAKECGISVYGVQTGMTKEGIDLGSSRIIVLAKPSIAMITGDGSNSGDAGEIWHMLDTRFSMPVTMITALRFGSADLGRYNVLIITGSPDISPAGIEAIKTWNRNGGTIIGYETGSNWLARNKFAEIEFIPTVTGKLKYGVYINRSADSQAQQIPGSIFMTKLDLTHPLCFGYTRDFLPVFKSTVTVAKKDPNIYNNPIRYTDDPLLSGYCTKE
ncbi:MAG: zinc carboxypeptidase, partial [Bacteroidia bacterium]